MKKISEITSLLEEAFTELNLKYFDNSLPDIVITVQSSPRTNGHFTTWKAWESKNEKLSVHEINIAAESLKRPLEYVIATLLHEMVHFYNLENGIKDTSRGGRYHNGRFKKEAEARGLKISYVEPFGYTYTEPTDELIAFVREMGWNNKEKLFRNILLKNKKSNTNSIKYACHRCGCSVRATKAVNISCADCNERMIKEN